MSELQAKETAGVVLTHAPSGPLSYSATASRCEAAGAGAHKKMSAVLKLDSNGAPLTIALPNIEDSSRANDNEIPGVRVNFSSKRSVSLRKRRFLLYIQVYNYSSVGVLRFFYLIDDGHCSILE